MPTVQQILNDIRTRLPCSTATFTDAVLIGWINDTQNEIWRYMASTEIYEFDTIAGQALYTLPSDCAFDMIKSVEVSSSTTIDGTESYVSYEYAGPDDELTGEQYYDALGNLGLYPKPSSDSGGGYSVKVTYEASPTQLSTGTLSNVPDINEEYQDILKWRVLRDIAGSGNNPDTNLVLYYQSLYDETLKKIKMNYYKRKYRKSRENWDYRQGWWDG